jgi:hypothetical protein
MTNKIASTYAYHPSDENKPDIKVATTILARYQIAPPAHARHIDPGLLEDVSVNGIVTPVKLYTNGLQAILVDGNHRVRVAQKLGLRKIPVKIIPDNFRRMRHNFGYPALDPVFADWCRDNLWAHENHEITRHFIGGGQSGGIPGNRFNKCVCSCGARWKEEV